MPTLFYGTIPGCRKRQLYAPSLRPIETSVFDSFMIDNLAPKSKLTDVALFWHFRKRKHSAFAWHDADGREQVIFLPAILNQYQMFEILRAEFPTILPSAITFRIRNEHEPYDYD